MTFFGSRIRRDQPLVIKVPEQTVLRLCNAVVAGPGQVRLMIRAGATRDPKSEGFGLCVLRQAATGVAGCEQFSPDLVLAHEDNPVELRVEEVAGGDASCATPAVDVTGFWEELIDEDDAADGPTPEGGEAEGDCCDECGDDVAAGRTPHCHEHANAKEGEGKEPSGPVVHVKHNGSTVASEENAPLVEDTPKKRVRDEASTTEEEEEKEAPETAGDGPAASEALERSSKRAAKKARRQQRDEERRALAASFAAAEREDTVQREANEAAAGVGQRVAHPKDRILPGNIRVMDRVIGNGAKVRKGKQVRLTYEGYLRKEDGKLFDSNMNRGRPFKFRLGLREVIEGLDRGVEGMKVGGTRRITIPAGLGYGAKGTKDGKIPPNSTLVFVVEVVGAAN